MGFTLFPGKKTVRRIGFNLQSSEIDAFQAWFEAVNKVKLDVIGIHPTLIGCVTYESPFSTQRMKTSFIREIVCPANGIATYPINRALGNLPAERLKLSERLRDGETT